MDKKTIIFDFDGTIADTFDVAIEVYNRIAPGFRCKKLEKKDIEKLQARRLQEFLKDYGVTRLKLPFLLLRARKELRSEIKNIQLISGMAEALRGIKNAGCSLGIMTSNSKQNVNTFLEMHGLGDVFDFVYSGRNIFGKDKVIRRLLQKHKIEKSSAVYVGDETRDIEAAKKAGIRVVSVSWGFNAKEILKVSKPDMIVDDPGMLLESLRKLSTFSQIFRS